ncbi:glucose-1-phosphate cytidylyltransferase [Halosquirtibacter xylanolyticus]|uniref:glucose-1-phosphate cytidylyltransferase n=1 Tax=Halosquirtibacter xylanolyticus TaxID=3374599 RepID=UPI0037481ED7|nr:glucose-1-phosphate cytidylyltransferase [Prolixibacteraceae bacterium]
MKAVILAGGFGTRLSESTHLIPKPMVEIGGKPILWHIMKSYAAHGIKEFIVCCGYKGYVIKEWFANYYLHNSDVTFDLKNNQMQVHNSDSEDWKVTLVDTGLHTMTGSRIKKVKDFIQNEPFCLTYGDGVSDINISNVIKQHFQQNKLITVTAYKPQGKFGALEISDSGVVNSFQEKPKGDNTWINAGYFVCQPEVLNYIEEGDNIIFEREPLEKLAEDNEMYAYRHHGFWKPMDILRDNIELNKLWDEGNAPWKQW